MINAVLRFADPAAATAAATDMNDAAASCRSRAPFRAPRPFPAIPTPSPPRIRSHRTEPTDFATIRAFAAHGPYVLMQFVQSIDGFDPAAAMWRRP